MQRMPGGIGEGAFEGDAAFCVFQVYEFSFAAKVFSFCFSWAHGVGRQVVLVEELLLQGGHVSFFVEIVHFLAEFPDGIAFVVCFIGVVYLGQYFFHGGILGL